MSTHRVTLDLPQESYEALRRMVESGEYASESEAVADALMGGGEVGEEWIPPRNGRDREAWLREEAVAAYDEHASNPTDVYTSEQVLAYLAEERAPDAKGR